MKYRVGAPLQTLLKAYHNVIDVESSDGKGLSKDAAIKCLADSFIKFKLIPPEMKSVRYQNLDDIINALGVRFNLRFVKERIENQFSELRKNEFSRNRVKEETRTLRERLIFGGFCSKDKFDLILTQIAGEKFNLLPVAPKKGEDKLDTLFRQLPCTPQKPLPYPRTQLQYMDPKQLKHMVR